MTSVLAGLVQRLDDANLSESKVIPWSCPIPSFGDISVSDVATLGLNPSNREFVDELGNELDGSARRFETLKSLKLARWADADADHFGEIWQSCRDYFVRNPYDGWFKRLDQLLADTRASYYESSACHLDLVPYATSCKWTSLLPSQRASLLRASGDTLGSLLRASRIRVLVLNGASVILHFQTVFGVALEREVMRDWSLRRGNDSSVAGYAYKGYLKASSEVELDRQILVLGFNHNIQSSFGVTREVMGAIQRWIGDMAAEALSET